MKVRDAGISTGRLAEASLTALGVVAAMMALPAALLFRGLMGAGAGADDEEGVLGGAGHAQQVSLFTRNPQHLLEVSLEIATRVLEVSCPPPPQSPFPSCVSSLEVHKGNRAVVRRHHHCRDHDDANLCDDTNPIM